MTEHLTCADVLAMVEPIASGDLLVSAALRSHLETCPRYASALASARRLEAALAAREAPAAPQGFAAAVMAQIRRERWRSEQRVDRLFNAAVVAAVVLLAGGLAALLNVGELLAAAAAVLNLATALAAGAEVQTGASLATYVAAAAFMASALAMWWWAERLTGR